MLKMSKTALISYLESLEGDEVYICKGSEFVIANEDSVYSIDSKKVKNFEGKDAVNRKVILFDIGV